jgi:hypothetical protein
MCLKILIKQGASMKNMGFKIFLLLLLPLSAHADVSKSFFSPQPISTTLAPQTAMFEEFARRADERPELFFFAVTPFFTRSQSGQSLRRSFLPGGKDEVVIKGSEAPGDADISGTWLQIMGRNGGGLLHGLMYNDFQSKLSIDPMYENLGVNLNFYKNLTDRIFLTGEVAFVQNKVTHGLRETEVMNETTRQATRQFLLNAHAGALIRAEPVSLQYSLNGVEALSNPLLRYGKLSVDPLKKEGLSDAAFKIGFDVSPGVVFAKIVIPTSQKPTAAYMFEPMTGNGGHLALGVGGSVLLKTAVARTAVEFSGAAEYLYLCENSQRRTFDLINGSWSRYLLMRDVGGLNTVPGVNYLTLQTNVTPGHTLSWNTRASIMFKKIGLHLGYNFYFAQAESLNLSPDNFKQPFNIASAQLINGAVGGFAVGISDSFLPDATIQNDAGSEAGIALADPGVLAANVSPMSGERILLQSAAQQAKLVSQVGISCGGDHVVGGVPLTCKIGYSYTFDHNKTALAGWAAWAQMGFKV